MKKLSLSLLVVILFATVGLGWGIDELFSRYQTSEQDLASSGELAPYLVMGNSLAKHVDLQQHTDTLFTNDFPSDHVTISITPLIDFQLPASLQVNFKEGKPLALESDDNISIHFILPQRQQVMTLVLARSLLIKDNTPIKIILTLVFYLGMIIVLLVWLYPLIRDLQALKNSATAFGKGDLTRRVNTTGHSYISDLQTEFNHMAIRIESLISDNKMLGNAVSHDLRTPLARLRFGIEMLHETVDSDKRKKYQNRMSRDIEEMENLVEILLCYARIEQSMVNINKRTLDLRALVNKSIESFSDNGNAISWATSTETHCFSVFGDANYLTMLVNNLLSNAVQYSNGNVKVFLQQHNANVILTIEDNGQGIPEEHRAHLLKPFTRGEDSITTAGFGMGLAIVDRIAYWHDAQLLIDDSSFLGGAKFSLIFSAVKTTDT